MRWEVKLHAMHGRELNREEELHGEEDLLGEGLDEGG